MPDVIKSGSGTLGEVMGQRVEPSWVDQEWDPHSWKVSCLTVPLPLCHVKTQSRGYEPGRRLSPDTESAMALILGFLASDTWETSVCCLQATQSGVFCYSSWNRLRQHLKPTVSEVRGDWYYHRNTDKSVLWVPQTTWTIFQTFWTQ